MKILMPLIFPLWGSGSGTYVRKLAEKLAEKGHDVMVVAPEKRKVKGVKIYNVNMPFYAAYTGHPEWPDCKLYAKMPAAEFTQIYQAYFDAIIDAVKKFKPEIIHINHVSFLLWIANYIKMLYGIDYVVTEHGTGTMNASIDRRYIGLTRDALNRADWIIAVSGDTKKWMLRVFGRKYASKTKVITGGVDARAYPKKIDFSQINKEYKLDNKKIVLFSGKLTDKKGVKYLIDAAPKINAEIFIIGDGPEKSNLEAQTKKLKLKNVHFLGYFGNNEKDKLVQFYHRADVFVAPSIWDEPLGLVILEAMSCKTAIVASRKGGIPLAVKNNYNGFLVRARSSKAIEEAVNKILKNHSLRDKFRENSRKLVEERFTWDIIADRIAELYKSAQEKNQKWLAKSKQISLEHIKETQRAKQELKTKIIGF